MTFAPLSALTALGAAFAGALSADGEAAVITSEQRAAQVDDLTAQVTELRSAIQDRLDQRKDPLDLPGSLTRREVEAYVTGTEALGRLTSRCLMQLNDLATARRALAGFGDAYDRLTAAKRALVAQAEAVPGDQLMPPDLAAALQAIEGGVNYDVNGQPLLPRLLREQLATTCPTCQHVELHFQEQLPILEHRLADVDRVLTTTPGFIAEVRAQAAFVKD